MKRTIGLAALALLALALPACGDDDEPSTPDPFGYGTLDDGRLSFCDDPANADDADCQ